MKYIIKSEEPIEFTEWKNQANAEWTPSYDKLSGNIKNAVYEALKKEQGFICCYCERELMEDDYHIEHLNPQEKGIVDPLEYSNMLCSCQRQLKKGEPRHCGNSKGKWFKEESFISPLSPECERKFKYTFDGHVESANEMDYAASITIDKLRLGIDKLNKMREKAIEPFIDYVLSDQELIDFVSGYLIEKVDNDGKYNPFYTTIKYLFVG
ncbi:MAG: TIGR02646 family protein [Paludibacter sp.]|nr:TIGR02646 family protein [Paludibacter sp.]